MRLARGSRRWHTRPVSSSGALQRELIWLRRLHEIARKLATEREVRSILPAILDGAIELTEAERGFLVLVDGQGRKKKIRVEAARGFARETLQAGLSKVSRTVVERVLERRAPLVTSREEDQGVVHLTSVRRRHVLSIACVPLLLRGEVIGVLYLDHRFAPGAFEERDLPVLMAFADQAVLVLEAARREPEPTDPGAGAPVWEDQASYPEEAPATAPGGPLRLPSPDRLPRFGKLVGGSRAMREVAREIDRCARSMAPVLIRGESGTGKELVARELHARGLHPEAPFLSENCAAIAESLLESELFGHERGAFTGAEQARRGLFVEAGEGTLFLDEVADTSPGMQAKLLRALQEREVRPIGGDEALEVRCRVIVAANQDLKRLVAERRFREDLYYRLDVLRIVLPPLRERREDLPALLAHAFARAGRPDPEVALEALEALVAWRWPGNVRELENEVRRLVARAPGRIELAHLSPELRGEAAGQREGFQGKTMADVEREMVIAALRRCRGNKSQAARELGVSRGTLYQLIERHGLG